MFYSQFILAKKGPLGTIWIAAHLERKLRKNQVADTDIGVSVDSILFPEVPIALRLSSHLLLGVVRIYSRKVNYLFHDCSEALLKIKQAFRSTAVDLPPEESTAPYHSITLPETFDLDDFELPDSAFLQGNYVDHHISTREQITLQDSMDGTGYTTLQFGLDERFGDGDASQIRLDLDEDIFLDKNHSPEHASTQLGSEVGLVHEGQASTTLTYMDIDEGQNGRDEHTLREIPRDLSDVLSNDYDKLVLSSAERLKRGGDSSQRHGYNIQTPDLNELFFPDDHVDGHAVPDYLAFAGDDAPSPDLFDCAQAPSTPGLMGEAIPANVQEIPALSPQEKTSSPCANVQLEFEGPATNSNGHVNDVTMDPESADNSQALSSLTSALNETKPASLAAECSGVFLAAVDEVHLEGGHKSEDHLQGGFVCNPPIVLDDMETGHSEVARLDGLVTPSQSLVTSNLDIPPNKPTADEIMVAASNDNVRVPGVTSAISSTSLPNKADPPILDNQERLGDADCSLTSNTSTLSSDSYLKPCNSQMNLVNILSLEAGGIDKSDLSILGNQSHVTNAGSCLISNAPPLFSDLSSRPYNSQLNQANIMSLDSEAIDKANSSIRGNQAHATNVASCFISNDQALSSELYSRPYNSQLNQADILSLEAGAIDKADPSILGNQCHATNVASCFISNAPVLSLDLSSMPDNSQLNQADVLSLEAGAFGKADSSFLGNQGHVINMGSFFNGNAPVLSSNLSLRPCNSQLNQANILPSILPSETGASVDYASCLPPRVLPFTSETPLTEQPLHDNLSSFKLQGEDKGAANNTVTVQENYHKPEFLLSKFMSNACKPVDQLTSPFPKETERVDLNCFSSSGYPEPEKMLFASGCDVNLPNYLGQHTAEMGVAESAVSVDRLSSLSGNKRHLMDSSPVLQNSNSMKMSSLPRAKRNTAYMPGDDDLLASILVGRTPTLKIGPTPPPPKAASRKRPRLTSRVGVPKRKVLLDDTMVLHADAIRQQLTNTEDIRRMRKKAPCTRPELWMIHKSSMEEELFQESLFTGISAELKSLDTRRYDVTENIGPQIDEHRLDEHNLYTELSKEMERSRMEEFVRESSGKEMGEPAAVMLNQVDNGTQESYGTSLPIEVQSYNEPVRFDVQEKLEPQVTQLEPSSNGQTDTVSTENVHERVGIEMPSIYAPHSGNELENATSSRSEEESIHEKSKAIDLIQKQELLHDLVQSSDKPIEMVERTSDFPGIAGDYIASAEVEVSAIQADETSMAKDEPISDKGNKVDVVDLNSPQYSNDVGKIENGEILVSMLDRCLLEDGAVMPADSPNVEHGNNPISDTIAELREPTNVETVSDSHAMEGMKNGLDVGLGGEPVVERVLTDEELATSEVISAEDPQAVSSLLHQPNTETESAPSAVGENNVENVSTGLGAARESEVALGSEPVVQGALADEEGPTSEIISSGNPQVVSSFLHQPNAEAENVSSAVRENYGGHDRGLEGSLDAESGPADFEAARESSDLYSAVDGDDTEFLNVEDDADFDEAEDVDMSNPEAQSLENSGWSTRTRGVARYLKTLFDEEYGRGKKVVAVDNLLAGKTRKEASRMFFETLVLKTRDYIHVEQENPFAHINIKPRPKLQKSEF